MHRAPRSAGDEETKPPAPEEEKPPTPDEEIDELFADLETLVKYMGEGLYAFTAIPEDCRCALKVILAMRTLFVVIFAVALTVLIILPVFFAVLVVRMVKVEVTKEQFARRAVIIAAETAAKHTLRLLRLFVRSLPISVVIFVIPLVIFLGVVSRQSALRDRQVTAFWSTVSVVGAVILLQVQGTVRACVTFYKSGQAREKTRTNATRTVQKWWRSLMEKRKEGIERFLRAVTAPSLPSLKPQLRLNAPILLEFSDIGLDANVGLPRYGAFVLPPLSLAVDSVEPPTLPSMWIRDCVLLFTVLLEALQLSVFTFRMLPIDVRGNFWIDAHLFPALFVRIPDPNMVLFIVSIASVAHFGTRCLASAPLRSAGIRRHALRGEQRRGGHVLLSRICRQRLVRSWQSQGGAVFTLWHCRPPVRHSLLRPHH